MGSGQALYINQTLVMVKLDISNKIHNIKNIISNAQILQTVVSIVIGEIHFQGWIWTVYTRVRCILFVFFFLVNYKINK